MADRCGCSCHDAEWASFRILRHAGHEAESRDDRASAEALYGRAYDHRMASDRFTGVDVAHVLEAAVACPLCQNWHTPALSGPCYPLLTYWPTLPPRVALVPLTPYVDGEGAES
jgi:hypothetical protein